MRHTEKKFWWQQSTTTQGRVSLLVMTLPYFFFFLSFLCCYHWLRVNRDKRKKWRVLVYEGRGRYWLWETHALNEKDRVVGWMDDWADKEHACMSKKDMLDGDFHIFLMWKVKKKREQKAYFFPITIKRGTAVRAMLFTSNLFLFMSPSKVHTLARIYRWWNLANTHGRHSLGQTKKKHSRIWRATPKKWRDEWTATINEKK